MIGADHQPHRVRRDNADEADDACGGDACADSHRDQEHDRGLQSLKANAEVESLRFAKRQRVKPARQERRRREHKGGDRRERGDLDPVRAAERAHRPEGEIAQLPVVADISEDANERTRQRGKRDASQQHGRDRRAAATRRDGVERRGRGQGADEGRGRQSEEPRPASPCGRRSPSTIASAAPRPAPADTPASPGSARGLRKRPCMSAPDIASAAPIISPRTSRGSRIWMTTRESCVGSTPRPSIAWTRISATRPLGTGTAPCVSESSATRARSATSAAAVRKTRRRLSASRLTSPRISSIETLTAGRRGSAAAATSSLDRGPPSARARRRASAGRSREDKVHPWR